MTKKQAVMRQITILEMSKKYKESKTKDKRKSQRLKMGLGLHEFPASFRILLLRADHTFFPYYAINFPRLSGYFYYVISRVASNSPDIYGYSVLHVDCRDRRSRVIKGFKHTRAPLLAFFELRSVRTGNRSCVRTFKHVLFPDLFVSGRSGEDGPQGADRRVLRCRPRTGKVCYTNPPLDCKLKHIQTCPIVYRKRFPRSLL